MYLIPINKGSDVTFNLQMCDADENPIDLTGFAISTFDLHSALVGQFDVEWEDASIGLVRCRMVWSDRMPTGTAMRFRVRWVEDGGDPADDRQSTPIVRFDVT